MIQATGAVLATLFFSCAPVNDGVHDRSESGRRSPTEETSRDAGAARPGDAVSAKAAPPRAPLPPPTPHLAEASAGRAVLEPIEVSPSSPPLAQLDDSALAQLIRTRTPELGSVSLGRPNRGGLFNGVQMPEHQLWHLEEPENAWGTRETIDSIRRAVERVESDHPGSPPLHIGHISRPRGGWLRPHRSHQSGRDVDLGYYYQEGPRWYAPATAKNLDRPRTWSLLMGLLTQGNVEYVFITRDVQALLVEYGRDQGFEESWLAQLFDSVPKQGAGAKARGVSKGRRLQLPPEPLVRHRWGHHTHLHVRFFSDAACEKGRRSFGLLRRNGKL